MSQKIIHSKSISALHEISGLGKPLHPLMTIIDTAMLSVGENTIFKVVFSESYSTAIITDITTGTDAESEIMGCATVAIYDNKAYTTNAQVGAIATGGATVAPFYIVEIPFEILGL